MEAARDEFVRKGWTGTTIPAIAASAGVSNETIYATFGSKQAVLQKLIERDVRGTTPDVPLAEHDQTRKILGAETAQELIDGFAMHITGILERVAPLMGVVRTAAETSPELRELYDALHAGRRRGLSSVADALARHGHLRTNLGANQTTDEIWRLASPELFMLLRRVEGMSPESYAAWLRDSLSRLLRSS